MNNLFNTLLSDTSQDITVYSAVITILIAAAFGLIVGYTYYKTQTENYSRNMAVTLDSEAIGRLRRWTVQYGSALLTGYIEKDGERLYSSCIVLANGEIVHNYRRITRGWKEYGKTWALTKEELE